MILPILLERAAKALVDTLETSIPVYAGESTEEMQAPAIIVAAGRAEEDFPESGIYHIPLTIEVVYMAADQGVEAIDTTANTVFAAFLAEDTTQKLMLTAGLSVLAIYCRDQDFSVSEDAHTQSLTLEVVAALL